MATKKITAAEFNKINDKIKFDNTEYMYNYVPTNVEFNLFLINI